MSPSAPIRYEAQSPSVPIRYEAQLGHERVAVRVDTWPPLGASAARRLLLLLGIKALRIYILDLYINMLFIIYNKYIIPNILLLVPYYYEL